ncbi:MAG: MarR family winged helix-turn-helix transcriptional regulator [Gemmatimonadota bacterium]
MTHDRIELGDLLARGAARWQARLVEGCGAAGFPDLTASALEALRPLFDGDGLPISEVGRQAGLPKSTMTTVVRTLEEAGLVRLEEDAADHRVTRLFLTGRGRELERSLTDGITRLRHRVTATLGPQGQQQLHKTLQRVLDSL